MMNKLEKEIKFIEIKYKNLFFLLFSLLVALVLIEPEYFKIIESLILNLGDYGIFGIFLAGSAYTLSFTGPVAAVVIYAFGEYYNSMLIAGLGALGSLATDLAIYFLSKRFIRHQKKLIISRLPERRLLKRFAPLIGFLILATPLPDEIGAALFSIYEKDYKKFAVISYTANFIGILFFAALGSL